MILAIDIGNTNVVMGLMSSRGVLDSHKRVVTEKPATPEEISEATDTYAAQLAFFLCDEGHTGTMHRIDGCIICSVVPEFTPCVQKAVQYVTGCQPMVVSPALKLGLTLAYDAPGRLGADLIADAVAGVQEHNGPLAIFDLGTATTASIVDAHKVYQGSMIIPGMVISEQALVARASQLPEIPYEVPARLISKNTVEAMQSGMFYGTAALIDGLINQIEAEIGQPVVPILTGGFASTVAPLCRQTVICDSNLLLKGLWDIYFMNTAEL